MGRKGTHWTIKTPRLRCKCGRTVHLENNGTWRIVIDREAPPATAQNTLSISPVDDGETDEGAERGDGG